MSGRYAFVTLVTSDSYLPGALAVAAALREVHPSPPVDPEVPFQTVCLVSPETVDVKTVKLLRKAFDLVVGVEVIDGQSTAELRLLGECPTFLAFFSRAPRSSKLLASLEHYQSADVSSDHTQSRQRIPLTAAPYLGAGGHIPRLVIECGSEMLIDRCCTVQSPIRTLHFSFIFLRAT